MNATLYVFGERKNGKKEKKKPTNVDEFLSVRKGEFIANGGHDRLFACVDIWRCYVGYITMVTIAFSLR